jgi:hypothetical protein
MALLIAGALAVAGKVVLAVVAEAALAAGLTTVVTLALLDT